MTRFLVFFSILIAYDQIYSGCKIIMNVLLVKSPRKSNLPRVYRHTVFNSCNVFGLGQLCEQSNSAKTKL